MSPDDAVTCMHCGENSGFTDQPKDSVTADAELTVGESIELSPDESAEVQAELTDTSPATPVAKAARARKSDRP